MTTPAEVTNGAGATGGTALGKRKKSRPKTSYLGTWLERAAHHTQDEPDYDYLSQNPYLDACRLNGLYPPEPVSLPTYPFYNPAQYSTQCWPNDYRYVQSAHKSIQVQRPRVKRNQNGVMNGFNYLQPKHIEENNEYTSLPPIVTSVGDTTSNSEANEKDSGGRRFSDPCLPRVPGEPEGSALEGERESSCDSGNSKLLMCLVDQINSLKVANEKLNKDLQETRAELQNARQQTTLWQKGSTSSLGTSNHNMLNNNGYLTSCPQYTPGVLSELVREIREAARLREEALCARVRTLVDERLLSQSGLSLDKSTDSRNYEDVKSELRAAEADKRRLHERLARLEEELRHVKGGAGLCEDAGEEVERARLRRELQDARRELQDVRRAKQQADEHTLRLERLVTQLRSCKLNGHQMTSPGPASIASASEAEPESPVAPGRVRRVSSASNSGHTIVFGPVTDL